MAQDITVIIAIISATSVLIGALIGAISTLIVTWMNKRTEERKHYRELLINAAIENYKEVQLMTRTIIEKRPTISHVVYPMDTYIIHMSKLAELVIDKKLKAGELSKILGELDQFTDEMYAHYNSKQKKETK